MKTASFIIISLCFVHSGYASNDTLNSKGNFKSYLKNHLKFGITTGNSTIHGFWGIRDKWTTNNPSMLGRIFLTNQSISVGFKYPNYEFGINYIYIGHYNNFRIKFEDAVFNNILNSLHSVSYDILFINATRHFQLTKSLYIAASPEFYFSFYRTSVIYTWDIQGGENAKKAGIGGTLSLAYNLPKTRFGFTIGAQYMWFPTAYNVSHRFIGLNYCLKKH